MNRSSGLCLALALSVSAVAGASAQTETKHLIVEPSNPPEAVAAGTRVSLALDVMPKRTMHVYAPGQTDYIPVSLAIKADRAIQVGRVHFPKPEKVLIKAVGESQLVYSRRFRLVQDITIAATPTMRTRARTPGATVVVNGTLRYQACDEIICYLPVDVPVAWTIPLKPAARVVAP
jgi:DsbC/DsbD-like thiol-disulfide interchange protein